MHYSGMMAMRMDALMLFHPGMFILSIIISIILAIVALYVNWWLSKKSSHTIVLGDTAAGAIVMSLAVSGMHYTGMSATYMFPAQSGSIINAMDPDILSIWVALASIFITFIAIAMTIIEKRMTTATGTASVSLSQLIEAIDSISDGFALFDTQDRLALMNQKYLQFMRLGSRESVMGESFDVIKQQVSQNGIFKTPQPDVEEDKTKQTKIEELTNGLWLRINERNVPGIGKYIICNDITEVKAAQLELAKANDQITGLNQRLDLENRRLGEELDVAAQLQQIVLPRTEELQNIPGLDISAHMQSADEVGGDYYDVLQHNGKVKIGMGDVTGHGLESGILMLMTQMGVRTLLACGESDPTRFLGILNQVLYDNTQRMGIDKSLTLMLLDYTPADTNQSGGKIRVSGQHEELILVRRGGEIERIDTLDLGFPLALEADITNFIQYIDIELTPGDGLVLYTDGITEAENQDGKQYEMDGLFAVISQQWSHPAQIIKTAIIDDVKQHIGDHTIFDDITLLVIKQK